jgi:hypothetical protein
LTKLLLLIVTAVPLVGLIEPVVVMWMSPAALVVTGVVVAVLIAVSAPAEEAIMIASVPIPVDARRWRIRQ